MFLDFYFIYFQPPSPSPPHWPQITPYTDIVLYPLSPVLVPPPYVIYGTICIPTQNQTVNRLTINLVSYLVGPPLPLVLPPFWYHISSPLHATVAPHFACPKPNNPIFPQPLPIPSPLLVYY